MVIRLHTCQVNPLQHVHRQCDVLLLLYFYYCQFQHVLVRKGFQFQYVSGKKIPILGVTVISDQYYWQVEWKITNCFVCMCSYILPSIRTCIDCAIDTTESREIGDSLFWCIRILSATLVCSPLNLQEGKLNISQDFLMNGSSWLWKKCDYKVNAMTQGLLLKLFKKIQQWQMIKWDFGAFRLISHCGRISSGGSDERRHLWTWESIILPW